MGPWKQSSSKSLGSLVNDQLEKNDSRQGVNDHFKAGTFSTKGASPCHSVGGSKFARQYHIPKRRDKEEEILNQSKDFTCSLVVTCRHFIRTRPPYDGTA